MTIFPPLIVPSPQAGTQPQQADIATLWVNVASFLQNKIVFRADQETTATTLPSSGAQTKVALDTVLEDPYSGWDAVNHNWGPPSGYSGWYEVSMTLRTAAIANLVELRLILGGTFPFGLTSVQGASSGNPGVSATWSVYLVGGQDTVNMTASMLNSAANVSTSLTAGQRSSMEICWLSLS